MSLRARSIAVLACSLWSASAAAQPAPSQPQPSPAPVPSAQPVPPGSVQPVAQPVPVPEPVPSPVPSQPPPAQPPAVPSPPLFPPNVPLPPQPLPAPGSLLAPSYPPPPYGPPPPGWPPGFGAPGLPPAEPGDDVEGVDADGLPLVLRDVVGLDSASFTDAENGAASTLVLHASVPLEAHTFFDARLPLILPGGIAGNAMLGAHHVARPLRAFWVSAGGALAVPLLSAKVYDDEAFELAGIARAAWDLHEVYPSIWPMAGHVGLEGHVGVMELRGSFDPILYFPFVGGKWVELVLQQAFEVQIGHAIHGGLRLQGVAFPTFDKSKTKLFYIDLGGDETDRFQFAMEPFFGVEHGMFSLRTGLMLPLDAQLGPPFKRSWGLELDLGVRL